MSFYCLVRRKIGEEIIWKKNERKYINFFSFSFFPSKARENERKGKLREKEKKKREKYFHKVEKTVISLEVQFFHATFAADTMTYLKFRNFHAAIKKNYYR